MVLFADGGYLASKPYAAGGAISIACQTIAATVITRLVRKTVRQPVHSTICIGIF